MKLITLQDMLVEEIFLTKNIFDFFDFFVMINRVGAEHSLRFSRVYPADRLKFSRVELGGEISAG